MSDNYIPKSLSKAINGAWVQWLPVNQAWAVMWMEQVLSLHVSYDDAVYEYGLLQP